MMAALLYLGCTVPVRNLNYELSARKVAAALGLTLVDDADLGCCGFPLKATDQRAALVLAARSLARAGARGLDLVPLCSACAGTLAEAAHLLDRDAGLREEVNRELAPLGETYEPGVEVRHFVRYLLEEVGLENLKKKVTHPLTGFSFAPHYGCHYLKPSEVTGRFDDPEDPRSIDLLLTATGAHVMRYARLKDCCGGGVLGADEELAGKLAGGKLTELNDTGVAALVVVCPFCNVMFEGQQKAIGKRLETKLKVPVVYLTQVLGLALGLAPDELGFKLNRSKPKELLEAFK
ncbi:MAG: CoB--CoM heterodisulfide reductase iron-sulfur subunit B family protein [Deltaproteobacteria bacterium]|nr:CoB--CoM heterodisulfide reductase iron-sulfur subunit B family protein [Deltaproteobacteria bacterium]